jgi:hypothetical protein
MLTFHNFTSYAKKYNILNRFTRYDNTLVISKEDNLASNLIVAKSKRKKRNSNLLSNLEFQLSLKYSPNLERIRRQKKTTYEIFVSGFFSVVLLGLEPKLF